MKKIIKFILIKISRIIFWITPHEYKEKLSKKEDLEAILNKDKNKTTFETFGNFLKKSLLTNNAWEIRKYAIQTALKNDLNKEYYYLEFGVYKGVSTNFFSKYVKKLYAFDSFEGLSEDWAGNKMSKYHFNLNKLIPKLNSNVEPVVGWVEDTLDDFLKKHKPKINFIHLDMDTYTPTKYTLEKIKPYLVKDAIILFDELFNYVGWKEGEYKALNDVFKEEEYKYKAFNIKSTQSAIQIK